MNQGFQVEHKKISGFIPKKVFIGLPGAGKTTWLTNMFGELTENRPKPVVIGTDIILEKMKLVGDGKYRDINNQSEKYTPLAAEAIGIMLKKEWFLAKLFIGQIFPDSDGPWSRPVFLNFHKTIKRLSNKKWM